ncbi:MAG: glycosyltransferase [Desulfuromonadaceae bacterium]|nr:glycosyltransferase [Desulfuromonadaceae bacterium]
MTEKHPTVSVAIITYNHEKYISDALESVLSQETNFIYEVIVGEDCSKDNTRDIIIKFQNRYPDKVKAILNEKNIGGFHNVNQVLKSCTGKYIALMEGDDCWTCSQKLQKQVDFFESHPDCTVCFHNVMVVYEDGSCHPSGSQEPRLFCSTSQKEISTIEDIIPRNFIPTSSTMYRAGIVTQLPFWITKLSMGDWPMHILHAEHGKIGYVNEVMGEWVLHRGGLSFGAHEDWKDENRRIFRLYDTIIKYVSPKSRKIVRNTCRDRCLYATERFESEGDIENARKFALKRFTDYYLFDLWFLKTMLRLKFPKIYTGLKTARDIIK